jgi:hypothetical protein
MQRDDAVHGRQVERRLVVRHQPETVADRVRAGVDDVAAAEIPGRPGARRVVDAAEPRCELPVEFLRERMSPVVAAEPAFDMGDGRAEAAAHQAPQHGRHRVAVHEDERRSPQTASRAQPAPSHRRQPPGNVRIDAQIAAAGAARKPDVGLS